MRGTTSGRAVAAMAVALLAVTGCGRGDGDDAETVEVVREIDVLEGVEAAGTARISWESEIEAPASGVEGFEDEGSGATARLVTSAEGVLDLAGGASEWSGTSATEGELPAGAVDTPVAAAPMRFEARFTPDGRWVRVWIDGEEPPPWIVHDLDEEGDEATDDEESPLDLSDPTSFDPTAFFDVLREEADSVTEVGTEEVRGASTTRYTAVVDADALDEHDELWPGAEDTTVEVDVWIDDESRLRRVRAGGLTLELWDFGAPVDVVPPDEVAGDDDALEQSYFDTLIPHTTGEWAPVSTGTTAGQAWEVWAAPGEAAGTPTTCRTIEVVGTSDEPDLWSLAEGMMGDEMAFPNHEGRPAACGSGTFSLPTGIFIADPAVQVIGSLPGGPATDDVDGDGVGDVPSLGAVVVRPDLRGGGARLVVEGGDPIDLALDAEGVAVWDIAAVEVVAVELDGGAIRCALPRLPGLDDGALAIAGVGLGTTPCIRV